MGKVVIFGKLFLKSGGPMLKKVENPCLTQDQTMTV